MAGVQPAVVIACAELWTYRQARRRGQRQNLWVWTAVVREPDGNRWADFEIGDRSEQIFLRFYERLPEGALYCIDAYPVYGWLPSDRHPVGKGDAVNWNEGCIRGVVGRKLNRLHRRTKGYTKSVEMPACSLALLLVDWPSKPYASLC